MAFAGSPSRRHCIKTSTSLLTERFEDAFLLLFPSCTRVRDRVIALSGRKVKDEKKIENPLQPFTMDENLKRRRRRTGGERNDSLSIRFLESPRPSRFSGSALGSDRCSRRRRMESKNVEQSLYYLYSCQPSLSDDNGR